MAITEIADYAHLSEADVEALGRELDAIRRDIEESRGEKDAAYIRRTITLQRTLDVGARAGDRRQPDQARMGRRHDGARRRQEHREHGDRPQRLPRPVGLDERPGNPLQHMGVGHGRSLGAVAVFPQLPHHMFTNVVGMDDDLGFGVMRITRDQPWRRESSAAAAAEPVAGGDIRMGHRSARPVLGAGPRGDRRREIRPHESADRQDRPPDGQGLSDLSRTQPDGGGAAPWRANIAANLLRNLWAYVVIFCGHFPDGAEKFTAAVLEHETRPEWYLRQMLGTANFDAGPVLAFSSGNLCYQIEHHLFPDLPSNRYAEIAPRVRALCDKYDLPYTTGSLTRQYLLTLRTIHKLALPDRFLIATSDDAAEGPDDAGTAG